MGRILELLMNLVLFHFVTSSRFSLHVLDIIVRSDQDYGDTSCWQERMDDGHFGKTPVLSCNLSFKKTLDCNLMSTLKFSKLDQYMINEDIFLEDRDVLSNMLEKSKGSFFGSVIRSLTACMNATSLCPLKGVMDFKNCNLQFELEAKPLSKYWKFYWDLLSESGRSVLSTVMVVEVDDTMVNREKRPTAAQRKRRKHGN